MAVSVSDNSADTAIAIDSVTANSRNSRPMIPPMNNSEMSTATSDTVNDTMVKPIWLAPFNAARNGASPASM